MIHTILLKNYNNHNSTDNDDRGPCEFAYNV